MGRGETEFRGSFKASKNDLILAKRNLNQLVGGPDHESRQYLVCSEE